MDRIIALIDMDCFYVQVEQRQNPNLVGKPCAVVQYNEWRGGGLLSVNYEARDAGVGRFIRGDDAQKVCPQIELVRVPEVNGKADLTKYRDAGREVIEVISSFATCVERASVDEAFVDLTEEVKTMMRNVHNEPVTSDQLANTFVIDWDEEETDEQSVQNKENIEMRRKRAIEDLIEMNDDQVRGLVLGATIVEKMRAAILEKTGFKCSAGISHNKVLSKLACGINKPNKQTIIPAKSVPVLFSKTSIKKIRNLGGKLGDSLQESGIEMMKDICKYSEKELQKKFGEKNGTWLYFLAQGVDNEPVKPRQLPLSIGCSKNFPGKNALVTVEQVQLWLERLSTEIEQRLEKDRATNNRLANLLNLHISLGDDTAAVSRSCLLSSYSAARITNSAYLLMAKLNKSTDSISWSPPIVSLGMSASKFQNVEGTSVTFMKSFFRPKSDNLATKSDNLDAPKGDPQLPIASSSSPKQSFFSKWRTNPNLLDSTTNPSTSGIQEFSSIVIKPVRNTSDFNEKLSLDNIDKDVLNNLPDDLKSEINAQLKIEPRKPSSSNGIAKFFQTRTSDSDCEAISPIPHEDQYTCDKCLKVVSVWNQLEHEDYHLAAQIQSEMNSGPITSTSTPQKQVKSPGVSKRKAKGRHKKGPAVKSRNITSYFKNQDPKNN